MNQGNNQNTRKSDLMKEIMTTDFGIIETALYLDVYPKQGQALDYYRSLVKKRDALVGEYEKTGGPLSIYGAKANGAWDWTNAPWPWEPEANV